MLSADSNRSVTIVGVIPARIESERLPGKVLRPICGRAMLHRVYDAASACKLLNELWVATDSEQVRDYCAANRIPVLMTARTHRSGTERIYEVSRLRPAQVYVNIQGDEPMLQTSHLQLLLEPFLRDPATAGTKFVTTLKTPLAPEEASNPNVVKVVTNPGGLALYFSRAAIPYNRDASSAVPYYKHLGLYAYTAAALEAYMALPASPLEQIEKLEQMRLLENGIPIQVAETALDTIGVDTEEDLRAVERYFDTLRGRG
ncbi:MAG: 3-deoxy-manno-octulosonate cytidylyltransferase [Acidobacteria bacterium]|nr:3-deoxy-manno-octulosonate cytidylyltransferase [Acidobacteriota bacterium]